MKRTENKGSLVNRQIDEWVGLLTKYKRMKWTYRYLYFNVLYRKLSEVEPSHFQNV